MAEFNNDNALGVSSANSEQDDLDLLINSTPTPAREDDLDALIGGPTARERVQNNLAISRDIAPDQAAKDQALGARYGLPLEAVQQGREVVSQKAEQDDLDKLLGGNTATTNFLSNIENAQVSRDSIENLSTIERVIRGFQRGEAISQLGYAGVELRSNPNLDANKSRVSELQKRLELLGQDSEGFVSALAGVAEFFGQRKAALTRPEAASIGIGTAVGFASPVPGGAMLGTAYGLIAHSIADVGEVEAGLSYVEQIQEGVDPNVAYWTSLGVGILNAGLETVGGASFMLPVAQAGKKAFKEGLKGVAKNPKFREAVASLVVNYSLNVGTEVITEVAQEAVNIAAEEIGKEFTVGKAAEWTPEKWEERLSEIALKTLKTTALLAAPGNAIAFARETRQQAKADGATEQMEELKKELDKSPLTQRSPKQAAQHVAEVYGEEGVRYVYMPVEQIDAVLQTEGADTLFDELGIRDQVEGAREVNGDVRVPVAAFSEHIIQTERFNQFKDHIKFDPEDLTKAQAKEQAEGRELDDAATKVSGETISRDITTEDSEVQPVQELAEHEMGMKALFDNANDAGLSEPQYASYLESVKRAKERGMKVLERQNLKRAAKRLEKKYLEVRADIQQNVEETLSSDPLYQAFLAIGRERLDRASVIEALGGDAKMLEALPTNEGRRIYAPAGQKGIDVKAFAEIYGFGPDVLLFQLMDRPSFADAVNIEVEQRMEQEQPTLLSEREQLDEAIRALATDQYAEMLAFELARIRQRRGQKRLKLSLVRAKARERIAQHKVDDINPRQYEQIQKREAKRARKAVRQGDWDAAAEAKLNQLLALEMMKESYKVRDELKKGNAFMRKFVTKNKWPKTLPLEYLEQIQSLLGDVQLGPRLSDKKRANLMAFAEAKAREKGAIIEVPKEILQADATTHYRDMPLQQWRDLYNTVVSLDKVGRDENAFRNAQEQHTVSQRVAEIAQNMRENLTPRNKPQSAEGVTEVKLVPALETLRQRAKDAVGKYSVDMSTFLLNTDSLLRSIDGFKDLGVAYKYIKGGIDRAITEGYLENSNGYVARNKVESEKLVALFDTFSKAERFNMWRQEDIPGVRRRLTRGERISVLLNMGNQGNIDALTAMDKDGNQQFTDEELQAVLEASSDKELAFAQAVWDYLNTFFPEVKASQRRRYNKDVEQVEALSFEVRGKTYKGGYYPIRYDTGEAVIGANENVEEVRQLLLTGGFSASHTRDSHTKARDKSNGAPVKLDPFVLNNHVQQVLYDLEVGDAIIDAYKVLHNKDLTQTFTQMGLKDIYDALDIWLGDVTTGELHKGSMPERVFRAVRTGTTISAMGFNMGVAALQPLGLFQSSVQIGHRYMLEGLWSIMEPVVRTGDITAPYKLLQEVTEMSGFMRERERSFNKDIIEAQKGIQAGLLSKITPGRTADHVGDAFFLFIAKAQRMVDFITWQAAYKKGIRQFNGDSKQAVQLADRMVARSQGSGNFQERTMVERGTLNSTVRQTELVRSFSLFLNYFAAKLNVAYERTKTAKMTPLGLMSYATDMALLFVVEGFLAAVLKEGWPDDDDEDERGVAEMAAWEGAKGVAAGIPFAREVTSAFDGFPTGGAWGSLINRMYKVGQQAGQGEVDDALIRATNSLFGIFFRYPSTQMNKTGDAIYKASEGEDIDWYEYLIGPRYNR